MANLLATLNQIATFLKVQPGKLVLNEYSIPICTTADKTILQGANDIIQYYLKKSTVKLAVETIEEKCEELQWIEYGLSFVSKCTTAQNIHQVLSELDDVLALRTFFVSFKLTVADLFLYYLLFNTMEKMQEVDKIKYSNLMRWFDNMQQNNEVRQKNNLITFKLSKLAINDLYVALNEV